MSGRVIWKLVERIGPLSELRNFQDELAIA
jgi:hypothetical protein